MYNSEYYKGSNYKHYLEREARYRVTAREILELLRSLCLLEGDSSILDYGCAVGLLLEGISKSHENCFGYDISKWAVNEGRKRGNNVYSDLGHVPCPVDIMIALDVFEHMMDEDVSLAIRHFDPEVIVARIPVAKDGREFYLGISNDDPTHINCKTKDQWRWMFIELGYLVLRLDLYTIYDSEGVGAFLLLKCR